MKALITGGAGFLGSHLADLLIDQGIEVRVLDNLEPQIHGDLRQKGLWPDYLNPKVQRILGSVQDQRIVNGCLQGVGWVIHLAASVGVGQSMADIAYYVNNNDGGTASLLQSIKDSKFKGSLLVASSMSIYGEGEYSLEGQPERRIAPPVRTREQLMRREWEITFEGKKAIPVPTRESKKLTPDSVYATTKRTQEELFMVVGKSLELPTVALRFFNAYGTRQALSNPYTGVAAIFANRLLNDQAPEIFEDGEQRRDFVSVKDVARGIYLALMSGKSGVYNIGSGRSISISEVAKTLAKTLGKEIEPVITQKYRVGDIRHCFADVSQANWDLGYIPQVEFGVGMAELADWLREQKVSLAPSVMDVTKVQI